VVGWKGGRSYDQRRTDQPLAPEYQKNTRYSCAASTARLSSFQEQENPLALLAEQAVLQVFLSNNVLIRWKVPLIRSPIVAVKFLYPKRHQKFS
jgi:hypothetical protein